MGPCAKGAEMYITVSGLVGKQSELCTEWELLTVHTEYFLPPTPQPSVIRAVTDQPMGAYACCSDIHPGLRRMAKEKSEAQSLCSLTDDVFSLSFQQ